MKTTKLIFSIALVALATTAFSLGDFLVKFSKTEKMQITETVVATSYAINQTEALYEEAYQTEDWMISPFESRVAEADLSIESWMIVPFEAAESVEVESWMTALWN